MRISYCFLWYWILLITGRQGGRLILSSYPNYEFSLLLLHLIHGAKEKMSTSRKTFEFSCADFRSSKCSVSVGSKGQPAICKNQSHTVVAIARLLVGWKFSPPLSVRRPKKQKRRIHPSDGVWFVLEFSRVFSIGAPGGALEEWHVRSTSTWFFDWFSIPIWKRLMAMLLGVTNFVEHASNDEFVAAGNR